MTLRQLIVITAIATIICWLLWLMVIIQVDPAEGGSLALVLFYASLFAALVGTFFLSSFAFRRLFAKFVLEYKLVGTSFRQSIFFALLIIGALLLQSYSLLNWWNLITLILAVTIIEFFFLNYRRPL